MRNGFLKCVALLMIVPLVTHCGLTSASNPTDGKKTEGEKSKGMIFSLRSITEQWTGSSDITLTRLDGDGSQAAITQSIKKNQENLNFDVPPGTYALTGNIDDGRVRFGGVQVAEVEAPVIRDQAEAACARRAELETLTGQRATEFAPPETPIDGTLHVITVAFALNSVCSEEDLFDDDESVPEDDDVTFDDLYSGEREIDDRPERGSRGFIDVIVSEPNTVLFLATSTTLTWVLQFKGEGSVNAVYLSGSQESLTLNVPRDVPVFGLFSDPKDQSTPKAEAAIEFMEREEQRYAAKLDLDAREWVCTDKPEPLIGYQNINPCLVDDEPTLRKLGTSVGNFEVQAEHLKAVTGLPAAKSIQSRFEGYQFVVTPDVKGEFLKQERIIGACYKEPNGVIREYWLGEYDENNRPVGEYCDDIECSTPGEIPEETTREELEKIIELQECPM